MTSCVFAGDRSARNHVLRFELVAVRRQDEPALMLDRGRTELEGDEARAYLPRFRDEQKDVLSLQNAALNVGFVGRSRTQFGERGVLVVVRGQKLKRKLRGVEGLRDQFGYCGFNFNGVHGLRTEKVSKQPQGSTP